MLVYALLILFFAFFYTAVVINPKETADNLRKYGGFLPGIRPGEKTAEYIDYVLTRITVVGALYLAAVCVLPEILTSYLRHPALLRRHLAPYRRQRHDGHGRPGSKPPHRSAV